jgi:outer membrane protein assembly factor BamB
MTSPTGARVSYRGALVVCPKCGRTGPADAYACRFCWTPLGGAGVELTAAEATALVEAERAALRREVRRRRLVWVRNGVLTLLLALLSYWLWFAPTPELPRPISPARSLVSPVDAPKTWPAAGGDVGATRATQAAVALDGAIAWRARLDSGATTALVADDHAVYVGVANAALVALSAEDGHELWRAAVPGQLDAPPTLAGDRLYVTLRDGSVAALDSATGQVIWRQGVGPTFSAAPLVSRGILYASALGDARMYDAEDGRELWEHRIDSLSSSAYPALGSNWLLTAVADRALVFDRTTGRQTFFFRLQAPAHLMVVNDAAVVVGRDLLVVFPLDEQRPWWDGLREAWGQLYIFGMAPRPPDQPNRWYAQSVRGALAPALADGAIVLATTKGAVRAIEVATGEDRWTADAGAISAAPVTTRGGLLIVGPETLTLLDPATGSVLKQRTIAGERFQAATVTERATYLVSGGGEVVALR